MNTDAFTTTVALPRFGFLSIQGKDAIAFMQGYTTCDLDKLSSHHAAIGAICNLQGRMVANFRLVRFQDGLLLRMSRDLVQPTRDFLGKYIVFSKAEMSDMSEDWRCYGVTGEETSLTTVGEIASAEDRILIRVSDSGPRFELWSGETPANAGDDTIDWSVAEIRDGLAWVDTRTTGEFQPQMFNYHRIGGIDFDKGCYLGQEIIARLEYRGQLKRKLHYGIGHGEVSTGDPLQTKDGRQAGTVVATAKADETIEMLVVLQNASEARMEAFTGNGEAIAFTPVEV